MAAAEVLYFLLIYQNVGHVTGFLRPDRRGTLWIVVATNGKPPDPHRKHLTRCFLRSARGGGCASPIVSV